MLSGPVENKLNFHSLCYCDCVSEVFCEFINARESVALLIIDTRKERVKIGVFTLYSRQLNVNLQFLCSEGRLNGGEFTYRQSAITH